MVSCSTIAHVPRCRGATTLREIPPLHDRATIAYRAPSELQALCRDSKVGRGWVVSTRSTCIQKLSEIPREVARRRVPGVSSRSKAPLGSAHSPHGRRSSGPSVRRTSPNVQSRARLMRGASPRTFAPNVFGRCAQTGLHSLLPPGQASVALPPLRGGSDDRARSLDPDAPRRWAGAGPPAPLPRPGPRPRTANIPIPTGGLLLGRGEVVFERHRRSRHGPPARGGPAGRRGGRGARSWQRSGDAAQRRCPDRRARARGRRRAPPGRYRSRVHVHGARPGDGR